MLVADWGSHASIYAIDKVTAGACTAMARTGFAFDAERARDFAEQLSREIDQASLTIAEAVGRPVKPLSPKDLGQAFFQDLRAPVYYRSALTGRPSLGVEAMRGYAASSRRELAKAALAVLNYRRLRKVRSTYIVRPLALLEESPDGRIHPGWLNYGTVSGRWSCQDPNLCNLPRKENDPTYGWGGIRSLYRARDGMVLVAFDAMQLEMRVAAYTSGDAAMIAACESQDLHASNAAVIWPQVFPTAEAGLRDTLRQLAKSAGFAVCYLAEAPTVYGRIVADGKIDVTLPQVEAMLQKLRRGFAGYFKWQEARLLDVIREGFVREWVTGRCRWLGHEPAPTEAANYPIQGGAAGILNTRLPLICERLAREVPLARLVASVYDSGVFEVPEAQAQQVAEICREIFEAPVLLHSTGLHGKFPIEIKISERWK